MKKPYGYRIYAVVNNQESIAVWVKNLEYFTQHVEEMLKGQPHIQGFVIQRIWKSDFLWKDFTCFENYKAYYKGKFHDFNNYKYHRFECDGVEYGPDLKPIDYKKLPKEALTTYEKLPEYL